jgi:dienelactone hydrolase
MPFAASIAAVLLLTAPPARSPLWGDLEPGPYAVGFRQIPRYDYSRVHRPAVDLEGRPRPGERARPIRVSVWYPAERSSAAPLTWGDYAAMVAGEEKLGPLDAADFRRGDEAVFRFPLFRDLTPEQRARLAKIPSAAVRDAAPASGRFPVVLYSLGSAFLAHATPEYLASHGYVVVTAPRVGAVWGLPPDIGDRDDLLAKVRDTDFLVQTAAELPFADVHALSAIGFSAGGRWALSEAMQNPDVRAVVSLDTVMLFQDPAEQAWKTLPFFDLERVRIPVLHVIRRVWVPREDPALWEGMKYADRTTAVFEDARLDHLDFQGAGWAIELAGSRPELSTQVAAVYSLWSRWTLAFLDLHVRKDAKARASLEALEKSMPPSAGNVTVSHRNAEPAPPSFAAIMGAIGDGDLASVERACRKSPAETGKPLTPEGSLNVAGYTLLFSGRPADAVRLFTLNVESYPRSGNALDSLADGLEASGDKAKALELSKRARGMVDADGTIDPARKKAILENIDAKLKRLTSP